MNRFAVLIREFGQTVGLPDLEPDEEGYCCLEFDGHIVNVEFNAPTEEVFLYAQIASLPETGREALYEALLEGNFFYRGTKGGTLGVDSASAAVVFVLKVAVAGMERSAFETVMEDFVNLTIGWKQKTAALSNAVETPGGHTGTIKPEFFDRRA